MSEPADVVVTEPQPLGVRLAGLLRQVAEAVADLPTHKGVLSIFDQAVVSGTNFATSVIIGRMCSKEELGVYYLAFSIVLLVRGIQEQIVSAPYMIYCHRRRGRELASYTGSTLVHQAMISLLTVIGLLGLVGVLSLGVGPVALAPAVWVLLGVVPFLLLREYLRQLSFAHLRITTAIAIDVAVAALQLGSLAMLAYVGWLSVVSVYLVIGAACAIASAGWFVSKRQPLRFVRSRFFADWLYNWVFGKWALAGQLVGCVAPYLMPWVVVFACGEAETGVLAACATLIGLSNMFVTGVANYLTPKAAGAFAHGGVKALQRVLWKTAGLFIVTIGGFCLLVFVASDPIAVFIYGDKYSGVGPIMTILALAALASSLGLTAGNGLWAMERPSYNFGADVCSLIVTLTAAFCLAGPYGVLGVATAEFVGMSTGTIVRCFTLFRLMKTPQ